MIFSRHSCSSVTFAQLIILRMSCFISRTGDTNRQFSNRSCSKQSILNQAPILFAYKACCFQCLFTYFITKSSSGETCQGSKEPFSSFLSPCPGRSKLKTCHPLTQIFSAKKDASSLFPPCPYSFEEQKVAKKYLVLFCEAQPIQPINLLYLKQLIEYLYRHKPKTIREANDLIDTYIQFYNHERIQLKIGEVPLSLHLSD